MHPVVKQLVALQQVDVRVAGVQRKIDSVPRETAQRLKKVDDLRAQRDEFAKSLGTAEAEYQDLDGKVRALDTAVKRQEQHRDESNNASAFTAAQHQIEYLSQDKDSHLTRQLELMEQIEGLTPQLTELNRQVEAAEAEFAQFEAEAQELMQKLEGQRDEVARDRAQFLGEIPPQSLMLYEDMFKTHNGQAVVPTEGGYCSGCYTKLTPNDLAYLRSGKSLITCKACGRILFLQD